MYQVCRRLLLTARGNQVSWSARSQSPSVHYCTICNVHYSMFGLVWFVCFKCVHWRSEYYSVEVCVCSPEHGEESREKAKKWHDQEIVQLIGFGWLAFWILCSHAHDCLWMFPWWDLFLCCGFLPKRYLVFCFVFCKLYSKLKLLTPVNASLRFSKIIGHLVSDVVQFSQSCVPLLWKVGCQQILIGTTAVKEVMWVLMYYNEWEMVSQKIGCRCISYIYLVHSPSIFSPFVYFTEEGPQHFGKPWSLKNICHPVSTVK